MGNQRLDHLLSKEQSEVIPIWLNSEQSDVGDGDITKELHRTIQFSKIPVWGIIQTVEKKSGVGTLEELLNGAVAQLARAPALQAGCRGFEPHQLHHTTSRWREK